MYKLADFNSVLQVAFGLNFLFYIFELVPHFENRLKQLADKHQYFARKKTELTRNHEIFPVGFVVSTKHSEQKWIFSRLTLLMSLVVLGFMLYDSFYPDARLSALLMWALLLPAFAVPWFAFYFHSRTVGFVRTANEILEKQIREAELKGFSDEIG